MHMSTWKNITTLIGKETLNLTFNLTKFGSCDNTVKNLLNSRSFFIVHIVLCEYVQFMIGYIQEVFGTINFKILCQRSEI